ncbi:MAG TPA: chromosomal replication initiator protein DnaA [Ktedonobacteraceae bacterium]|nr:chromosomal replication initiator protein DnaA [Ktedonobacteraceae bacterium]
MNAKQIWQTTIARLQAKVSPAVFSTWFQGTSAVSFQDGVFVVRVPTTFAKAHLEGRFTDIIRTILTEITGQPVEVQFVVAKESVPGDAGEMLSGKQPHRTRTRHPATPPPQQEQQPPSLPIAMTSSASSPARPTVHRSIESNSNRDEEHGDIQKKQHNGRDNGRARPEPLPLNEHEELALSPSPPLKPPNSEGLLNPRYRFSTFIVGKSNKLAHAASLAVADNPGRAYNPLFFYGGVGLGKTHLLHAIGHVGEANGLNVLYVTSEKFTNEIINAIRYQKTEDFRMKYRQIDILLVDDIQFIAGKESTEEEFFHTFNTLHNANKQIVVTSDRPPKAIHSLQDRLRSRFEWGLLADIQPPEYEHRLAILRSKTESLRFSVPPSVIEYIARPECKSVRELEGALNRVIAYATLHDAPLTVGLAMQALEHLYTDSKPLANLTVAEVLEGVCRYYGIDPALMRGKQRDREIVWPRQIAMYIMREETDASWLQIGAELGGRDHTTIMHGWEKVRNEIANNDNIRREVAAVLESLSQPG